MVLGEREIAGQVRRAITNARELACTSKPLELLFQAALHVSKRIASDTALSSTGRSVVNLGLDLAGADTPDWPGTRCLLIGTGSYAGACVAALRRRQAHQIEVFSQSGRAAAFAQSHDITPIAPGTDSLIDAVSAADLIIAVSGVHGRNPHPTTGSHYVLDTALMNQALDQRQGSAQHRDLTVLDLALHRDIDPAVSDCSSIKLYDLQTLQRHVPPADRQEIDRAQAIVSEAVSDFTNQQAKRAKDSDIAALVATNDRQIAESLSTALADFQQHHQRPATEVEAERIHHDIRKAGKSALHHQIMALRAA
jgi:glutamyl-tRNA reductase